jgi:hypothetical protein
MVRVGSSWLSRYNENFNDYIGGDRTNQLHITRDNGCADFVAIREPCEGENGNGLF